MDNNDSNQRNKSHLQNDNKTLATIELEPMTFREINATDNMTFRTKNEDN